MDEPTTGWTRWWSGVDRVHRERQRGRTGLIARRALAATDQAPATGYRAVATRRAPSSFALSFGHGLGTVDNLISSGIHENAALIAGGPVTARPSDHPRRGGLCGEFLRRNAPRDARSRVGVRRVQRRRAGHRRDAWPPGSARSPTWMSTRTKSSRPLPVGGQRAWLWCPVSVSWGALIRAAVSKCSACTNAWGRLPRSWRSVVSYSSEYSPGDPQALRVRSNQAVASTGRCCWCRASATRNPQKVNDPSASPSGRWSCRNR